LFKVGFCTKVDFGFVVFDGKGVHLVIKKIAPSVEMKPFILVFLLFPSLKSIGQINSFDKVIISYGNGHNSWVIPGPYASEERFEFVTTKNGTYKLAKYLKLDYSLNSDSVSVIDTVALPFHQFKVIAKTIDALYQQLATTKPNFTLEFIKPFLKTPQTKEILSIAKKIDRSYLFEDYDRNELAQYLSPIKHFNKLDSFVKLNRPDTNLYIVTVDSREGLGITFIKNRDTTGFYMDLLRDHPLGQPILERTKVTHSIGSQFINLEPNILLEEMLPVSSAARKRIRISSFTEEYIEWYLKKVL